MSQTATWSANLGNTTRVTRSSGAKAGSGNNQRLYVGFYGGADYDAYLRFTLDWTNVGRIVSAVLNVYTDDGLGVMDVSTTANRKAVIRRLTSAFSEGVSPGTGFSTDEYTNPSYTTSHQHSVAMARGTFGLSQHDITDIVEDWAPSTVKKRDGTPGSRIANYGIALNGFGDANQNWAGFSEDYTDSTYRPTIVLTYEYGVTVPDAPTNLSPSGAVAAFTDFEGDFSDVRSTDQLRKSEVQVFDAGHSATIAIDDFVTSAAHGLANGQTIYFTSLTGGVGLSTFLQYYVVQKTTNTFKVSLTSGGTPVNVTTLYTAATWSRLLYYMTRTASQTEIEADHFIHTPDAIGIVANTNYRWRVRVHDNEGQVSAFTALTTFSFTNTAPNAPSGMTPTSGSSKASLDGVLFRGNFTDPDAGGTMLAYQIQMSAYASGDPHWDDDAFILWNTGKIYTSGTSFETPYGGDSLLAGTYYWRARVWDDQQSPSNWTYSTIIVSADFVADPASASTAIQLRPRAPWRIVIKAMGALRGPGSTVAVIEDAKNAGASLLYNSPGDLHFTLHKSHPQLSVIEPKQTHYSVQFRSGDGWREVFAGLMWDFDATDTDIIFYGIDYLALLDYVLDERYDPSRPDLASESGGSKYVTAGKNTIWYIVQDQLYRAAAKPNSPVGFITGATNPTSGRSLNIANMTETLTVFSTYAPTLNFITGLLDSHRAGQGKRTRLSVRPKSSGGYEFKVDDDPGQVRDNLRLRYGELVQGYRVVPFGTEWASRISAIGRAKDGIQVIYKTATAPGIDEAVWGHFAQVRLIDGVSDENDLVRRTKQAALHAGKLGKSIALGIRTGFLQPRDGYDVCDNFPVDIEDGSVSTSAFGSGYWSAVGVTWQAAAQNGKQDVILTLQPKEDGVSPSSDLLLLAPISPQEQWQIGWAPPNPLTATSKYWLDQNTGITYKRVDGTLVAEGITGTA